MFALFSPILDYRDCPHTRGDVLVAQVPQDGLLDRFKFIDQGEGIHRQGLYAPLVRELAHEATQQWLVGAEPHAVIKHIVGIVPRPRQLLPGLHVDVR